MKRPDDIDPCRATCGEPGSHQRNNRKHGRHRREDDTIMGCHPEEQAGQQARQPECRCHSDRLLASLWLFGSSCSGTQMSGATPTIGLAERGSKAAERTPTTRCGVPVEGYRPAHDASGRAKPALPESVTEDHHTRASGPVLLFAEAPALNDARVEETEEIGADKPHGPSRRATLGNSRTSAATASEFRGFLRDPEPPASGQIDF